MTNSLRTIGKRLRSSTIDSPQAFQRRFEAEWRTFARLGRAVVSGGRHNLLLAPSGGGNIGDQAMVEAFIENVAGPITVISFAADDFPLPREHRDRVRVIALPKLVTGGAIRDEATLQKFASLLDGSSGFSVIGADVLDGGYSYRRSVQRTSLAIYAARLGIDSRILGFSLNEAPDIRCISALSEAGEAGVRLLLRDPVSASRARSLGLKGVEDSSDLVFSARTIANTEDIPVITGLNAPYALVNVNSLISRRIQQAVEYHDIVNYLKSRGLGVVFVPHDARQGSDDIGECRRVYDATGASRAWLIDRLLGPAQIRALAASAAVVVTGRMHLAIMALCGAVPTIPLSYQGKLAGLMRLFDIEDLIVEPNKGFGAQVTRNLETVLASRDDLNNLLFNRLAAVRELSLKNYAGLAS